MKWQKQGLEKLKGWGCTPELAGPGRELVVLKRKGWEPEKQLYERVT